MGTKEAISIHSKNKPKRGIEVDITPQKKIQHNYNPFNELQNLIRTAKDKTLERWRSNYKLKFKNKYSSVIWLECKDTQDGVNQSKQSMLYSTRITYKVLILTSEDLIERIWIVSQKLLVEIHQSGNSITIHPWKNSDSRPPHLSRPEQVMDSSTKLCKYFDIVNLPKNWESATVYTSFYMGHDSHCTVIKERFSNLVVLKWSGDVL